MNLLKIGVLLLSMTLAMDGIAYGKRLPDFKDYPSGVTYTGKSAAVILDTADARQFRTRLREAAKRPPDFAGEYVLALFGCGTNCIFGAAVSKKTGHAAFLPGSVCCWHGEGEEEDKLQFRLDSRLLIARGSVNENALYGSFYYVFDGRKFNLARFVPAEREAHQKRFGERMWQGFAEAEKTLKNPR